MEAASSESDESVGPLVLVVEDEQLARVSIRATLLKNGFRVLEAENGESALGHFSSDQVPRVVVLDIGLPSLNGFEVCKKIRETHEDTAILMLTARADPADKIAGLTLGADDYLVKPFVPGELVARIRAVLRRSVPRSLSVKPITFGTLYLDFQTQKATKAGIDLNLSPREFALLGALLHRPGQVMTREQLGEAVWGSSQRGKTRAMDVFVCKLRNKLEEDPSTPRFIKTVRGAGYSCG